MSLAQDSEVENELTNKIVNNLKCEECLNYIYPPISLSKNDYKVICGRCKPKFQDDTLINNEYLTKIGELLEFPCFYKQYGCKKLSTWKDAKRHENACIFRRYKCPSIKVCDWTGSPEDLKNHFFSKHSKFDVKNKILLKLDNYSYNYVIESSGELFVFHTKCDMSSDLLVYDVRFVGPPQRASRFHFKIELSINDKDYKYTEKKQVEPDDTWNLNEAEALQIRIGMLKTVLKNSNEIYLKLEISTRVPLGQADKTLMHEMDCPVCKDHMIRPIRMCATGHNICNNCYLKLSQCPSCRAGFIGARNITLETLSEHMHYRCMYYEEGCSFTEVPDKIKDHEMKCEVSYYDCPFKQLGYCSWRGRVSQVSIHIAKEHDAFIK